MALKTLGLLALMARAGLFLPISRDSSQQQGQQGQQGPGPGQQGSGQGQQGPGQGLQGQGQRQQGPGHERPVIAWFGRVLADIGDSQSLQQNLSTFSGHVRRIRQVGRVVIVMHGVLYLFIMSVQ